MSEPTRCPDCSAILIPDGKGCLLCTACGYCSEPVHEPVLEETTIVVDLEEALAHLEEVLAQLKRAELPRGASHYEY